MTSAALILLILHRDGEGSRRKSISGYFFLAFFLAVFFFAAFFAFFFFAIDYHLLPVASSCSREE